MEKFLAILEKLIVLVQPVVTTALVQAGIVIADR
jgi:hypothetical protein